MFPVITVSVAVAYVRSALVIVRCVNRMLITSQGAKLKYVINIEYRKQNKVYLIKAYIRLRLHGQNKTLRSKQKKTMKWGR